MGVSCLAEGHWRDPPQRISAWVTCCLPRPAGAARGKAVADGSVINWILARAKASEPMPASCPRQVITRAVNLLHHATKHGLRIQAHHWPLWAAGVRPADLPINQRGP